ncbi:MAG TPA: transcriptional regulator [Gemmatimonadales bacterium]
MADRSAARRARPVEAAPPRGLEASPGQDAASSSLELDRLIHERVRLAIVSALAVTPSLTFNDLKHILGTTDGNLSVHARKLEEAGYVTVTKSFAGRMPRTEYALTGAGRTALERYVGHMEDLIRMMKGQER